MKEMIDYMNLNEIKRLATENDEATRFLIVSRILREEFTVLRLISLRDRIINILDAKMR